MGLLAWNSVVLILSGSDGTMILMLALINTYLPGDLGWMVGILIVMGYLGIQFMTNRTQGLVTIPISAHCRDCGFSLTAQPEEIWPALSCFYVMPR